MYGDSSKKRRQKREGDADDDGKADSKIKTNHVIKGEANKNVIQ